MPRRKSVWEESSELAPTQAPAAVDTMMDEYHISLIAQDFSLETLASMYCDLHDSQRSSAVSDAGAILNAAIDMYGDEFFLEVYKERLRRKGFSSEDEWEGSSRTLNFYKE